MTLNEIQNQIIEEFEVFDEWLDKYEYLIELGKDLAEMDESSKTKDKLIEGCQSQVWLDAELKNNKIEFTADSDALITKGIAALLLRVLNQRTPEEILSAELFFIEKIGLQQNLSPTRANGLVSMMKQIKMYALAFHTKLHSKVQSKN